MEPFIGQIIPVGFSFAPVGWLACDGAMVSISQYGPLVSLIGTTYGGDGVNDFGLPDLRGSVAVGAGQAAGLSMYTVGEPGGSEAVTLSAGQVPVHTHALNATSAAGTTNVPGSTVLLGSGLATPPLPYAASAPDIAMAPGAMTPNGGGQPHANVQPVTCINYIIATDGIYPSPS